MLTALSLSLCVRQYVALSRCRCLRQLHLWGLHRGAITADPEVAQEYVRLAKRPLTEECVRNAAARSTPPLPHLSMVPHVYTDT